MTSYTESGRLSRLQATVRACAVNTAIEGLRCQQRANCPVDPAPLRPVGNFESGRLAKAVAQATQCCAAPRPGNIEICCKPSPGPPPQTLQTEGAYLASRVAACEFVAAINGGISAGGVSESQRLRLIQDQILNVDYTQNPDARFLQYQRFFPAPCPAVPPANNLPLTQPEFGCAQKNQFPFA
jgi:hypothetical protein